MRTELVVQLGDAVTARIGRRLVGSGVAQLAELLKDGPRHLHRPLGWPQRADPVTAPTGIRFRHHHKLLMFTEVPPLMPSMKLLLYEAWKRYTGNCEALATSQKLSSLLQRYFYGCPAYLPVRVGPSLARCVAWGPPVTRSGSAQGRPVSVRPGSPERRHCLQSPPGGHTPGETSIVNTENQQYHLSPHGWHTPVGTSVHTGS